MSCRAWSGVRLRRTFARLRDQEGQALVLATTTMFAVLAFGAMTIDTAKWYQKHHQAQVGADAAALAAANCLANSSATSTSPGSCTTMSDTTATTVAQTIASANGNAMPASNVTVGFDSVTVTVPTVAPTLFARVANIAQISTSASAVARFYPSGAKFSCPSSGMRTCTSFFAANTACPSLNTNTTMGLVLVTNDSGGGNTMLPDAYSNGYVFDGANSASSAVGVTLPGSTAPTCSTANVAAKGETAHYISGPVPYPAVWPMPTTPNCTRTASYFSTQSGTPAQNQITTPGVYCVTSSGALASSASPSCQSTPVAGSSGYLYVDESSAALTAGGWYEFVSPCTIVANSATPTITNVPGQPLVYGTANVVAPATASALPTCSAAANAGTAGSDLYVVGSNANISAPLYDQCGTIDVNQNNAYLGFLEGWNVVVEKNNTVTGNGPTSPSGGGVTTTAASDSLGG